MRNLFTLLFILFATRLYCQTTHQIGELHFTDCKIIKKENVIDTISGLPVKMVRLTIIAKTKVQVSCNFGDPSKDKYKVVKNKIAICYAYDSSGIIHDSIIGEIKKYADEQEAWAKKYKSSNDFSNLLYNKSFFLKDSVAIPYIRTMGENPGDYQLFYVNKQVYKIELLERKGLGSLSTFVFHNTYFTKDNKRLDLGQYIKNIDKVREILAGTNY
jgi:hypothetical protein